MYVTKARVAFNKLFINRIMLQAMLIKHTALLLHLFSKSAYFQHTSGIFRVLCHTSQPLIICSFVMDYLKHIFPLLLFTAFIILLYFSRLPQCLLLSSSRVSTQVNKTVLSIFYVYSSR